MKRLVLLPSRSEADISFRCGRFLRCGKTITSLKCRKRATSTAEIFEYHLDDDMDF
jgi:hypothetical protein